MPLFDNDDVDDDDEPVFSIFTLNFRPNLEANDPSLNGNIGYSRIWAGLAYEIEQINKQKKPLSKCQSKWTFLKFENNQYWRF